MYIVLKVSQVRQCTLYIPLKAFPYELSLPVLNGGVLCTGIIIIIIIKLYFQAHMQVTTKAREHIVTYSIIQLGNSHSLAG